MISFQRLIFYLILLTNWSFNPTLSADVVAEVEELAEVSNQVGNEILDLKLLNNPAVFDYQVTEPLNQQPLNRKDLIDNFRINLDLLLHFMEFIFDTDEPDNFIEIYSFMKVSKTFYSAAKIFMSTRLSGFKCTDKSNPAILTAFCVVFGNKRFQGHFSGLKGRPIDFKDLLEIGYSANYRNGNVQIRLALNHLRNFAHHPDSLAFSEYDHFPVDESSQIIWLNRASDRVFRFNQLPYSAEMYFLSNVFSQQAFFDGICEIKDNPQLVSALIDRFFSIPNLYSTIFEFISISVEKGNILVLEKLLEIASVTSASVDIFDSHLNNFLEILINKNLFSLRLLELSRSNKFAMEKSLLASLKRKNIQFFMQILNHYDFEDLKWGGCKYLLSRENDILSFYNHRYFVNTFIISGVDITIYPLLMPIFDLRQVQFKEIFKRLTSLEEYDFGEPTSIENSLIYHCLMSNENYLELLPSDVSHFVVGYDERIAHVREVVNLQPHQIKLLLSHSRNPVNLLYFTGTHFDTTIVSELIHLFDINKINYVYLSEISLKPLLRNSFSGLNNIRDWPLLHLAIVYQKINLIEMIVSDKRFNRNQLKFKLGNRWTAMELADEIIRFDQQSPYLFPIAHQLEKVSELFK